MRTQELKLTNIGADYLANKAKGNPLKSVDDYLDLMNKLKEKKTMKKISERVYSTETEAIKEILVREQFSIQ